MFPSARRRTSRSARAAEGSIRIAIRIVTAASVIVAIVPDVRHTAAASRRVRVLPDSAGSVVLVRAAAVVRTDSATAIDQGRAAPVVPARARGAVRDLAVEENAVDSVAARPGP